MEKEFLTPPLAQQIAITTTLHGHSRIDDYAWLKDQDWRAVMQNPNVLNQEIRAYLEEENRYTQSVMKDTEILQDKIFEELKSRIKEDDESVPVLDGEYSYFTRYDIGAQHPMFLRYKTLQPDIQEVILNANDLAKGLSYFHLGECEHSPNHKLLAYSYDTKGSEFFAIKIKNLNDHTELPEIIQNVQGDFVWTPDSRTIYYTTLDENHRADKVMRHHVGRPVAEDEIVYEEKDPGFFISLDSTESRRFLIITAHDHTTTEVYTIDTGDPNAQAKLVARRETGIEYEVSHHNDFFLILANTDGVEDYKLARTHIDTPSKEYWKDLYIPARGTLLISFFLYKNFLVRVERKDSLPTITISELHTDGTLGAEHQILFNEEIYELDVLGGYEYDTSELRFMYSSMTIPNQVYDYDMVKRTRVLRKQQIVPRGHDPHMYITRRLFAETSDGQKIPVSLLYRRDAMLDGNAPLMLYAYGAYGHSIPANFSTDRLSLVDRGIVYAIAHVRGGMEKGYAWYKGGKLKNKTRTFFDYLACAEFLIKQNYTSAGKIIVYGASAGGMLVGAVLNLCPDLFKAAIADVPFVDVLNTMCDATLPLTPPEWPEWGNPIENAEDYQTILNYSPYENIKKMAYPHLLVIAGLTDPRVTYWEPAKWVAKLRRFNTSKNLVLLKTNMDTGHRGASGRYDYLREIAFMYAFILKTTRHDDAPFIT